MDRGPKIEVSTGKFFYPLDPRPEEICIEDIAGGLSRACRFTKQTREFYSVAQHSCYVADRVPRQDRLWALLHDASEAYLADISSPLKPITYMMDLDGTMVKFKVIEKRVMRAVCEHFGLAVEEPKTVKPQDVSVFLAEARDLMVKPEGDVWPVGVPMDEWVHPLGPKAAKVLFMSKFYEIKDERKSFLRVPLVEVK